MADPHQLLRRPPAPASLAALTACSLLLATPDAHAQTGEASPASVAITSARVEFERGVALAQSQRWSEAVEAFRRSRAQVDRPRSAFNMALALQRLGRMREARQALHQCLAFGETGSDAALRRDAESLLVAVGAAVATLYVAVAPGTAELRVDGERQVGDGAIRTLDVDPGRHQVSLSAEGLATQEFVIEPAPGERLVRRVDLATRPVRLRVSSSLADAAVSVDDDLIGRGRSVEWSGPPGAHRLRVEAPGYRTERRPLQLGPGETAQVVIELQRERTLARNPWLWVGVGAGVVAVATTIALLVISSPGPLDGGSTGQVFQAAGVQW